MGILTESPRGSPPDSARRNGVNALFQRIRGLVQMLWREVAKFGVVGAAAWVIDTGIYLWLMNGQMHSGQVWAKAWATVVASIFAWVANRYWTFRHRRQSNAKREFVMFALMNGIGLLIAAACVAFTKYVLGLDSTTAMFVSGSVVGLVLGTIFRYFAYRFWVFSEVMDQEEEFKTDHELLEKLPTHSQAVVPKAE